MLIFRIHAVKQITRRHIRLGEVSQVIAKGEIIETYPEDKPFPSRLLLGIIDQRPLHVVAADHPDSPGDTYVVTVYEPNPDEWDSEFRRRINR